MWGCDGWTAFVVLRCLGEIESIVQGLDGVGHLSLFFLELGDGFSQQFILFAQLGKDGVGRWAGVGDSWGRNDGGDGDVFWDGGLVDRGRDGGFGNCELG